MALHRFLWHYFWQPTCSKSPPPPKPCPAALRARADRQSTRHKRHLLSPDLFTREAFIEKEILSGNVPGFFSANFAR